MLLKDNFSNEIFINHLNGSKYNHEIINPKIEKKIINRLCGDEIKIFANYQEKEFTELSFQSNSCSIAKVSTSILLNQIIDKNFLEVKKIINSFNLNFESNDENYFENELDLLLEFKKMPTRKKCVLLSFNLLKQIVEEIESNGRI